VKLAGPLKLAVGEHDVAADDRHGAAHRACTLAMLKVSPSTSVSLPSSVACAITAGVLLVAAAVSSLPLALLTGVTLNVTLWAPHQSCRSSL
jgi:hypothetical protein